MAAALFVALTIPLARLTDWVGRRGRSASGRARCERRVRTGDRCCASRDLRKAYGDRVVLSGLDLRSTPHDVVCLIGASGSGKSTLLRCLDLLESIDDGTIGFEGARSRTRGSTGARCAAGSAMVFQAYNLFPHLSVLDNVTLAPRRVHGVSRADGRGAGPGAAVAVRARRPRRVSTPTGSPGASSSGPRSSVPWPPSPHCCCSTR